MVSSMSMSPTPLRQALWHWVVEGAEPCTGTEDELVQQLSTGRLPPYALVWREGWGEWLPAMQVEALAEAFPDAGLGNPLGKRTARPSVIPGIPPVPVSDYPRLRHLAKASPLGWPDGFEGPEQEVITSEVPAVVLQEAARVMTQPTPPRDLGLQEAIERASRLPPERASRLPDRPALLPPEHLASEYLASERSPSESFLPEPSSSERPSQLPPEHSVLIALDRSPLASRVEERTPVSGPALPLATELGLEALIAEAAPARSWAHWLRAHGLWLALGLGLLGVGVTFGLRWFGIPEGWPLARPTREVVRRSALLPAAAPTAATTTGQGAEPGSAPALPGCRFRQPPALLDDWAVVDVRPVLHPLASGHEVAIGYAQSHRSATGGILDVGSLRLERQFWQQQDRQVFSVTPLEVDGTLRYHVERQGTNVAFARAVAAEPPARVGASENAVVLGRLEQRPQSLWPLPAGSTLTVPEVAEHPLGFTLAVRASHDVGHVLVGLIDTAGAPLAPLVDVGKPEWDLGRPALASGPEQTVLAVTRRQHLSTPDPGTATPKSEPVSEQADELLLAHARNGLLPTELRRFELPPPAAPELSAPIVAALPDGGFALMWSQGSSAQRQVRLQRLSAELRPLGAPFDVTSMAGGANATGAALHWVGDRLLVFYFAKRDAGHALWVSSVGCGA
jgi:hypothetical protein